MDKAGCLDHAFKVAYLPMSGNCGRPEFGFLEPRAQGAPAMRRRGVSASNHQLPTDDR